ncbi:hypothetical protein DPMN_096369 [Dreissena polymorpha]|uniref:Uncharacterized protein n=1 Tax=Dreissena polymorpha TaxID=45954 RepID=A0A9D4L9R8_DREPO|nr:hypothetical protein DPMN_096369 [Dreissena polymorpha]
MVQIHATHSDSLCDDVCATCENIRKRVVGALEEEEKLEATDAYGDHIRRAKVVITY